MSNFNLKWIVEALLMSSNKPLSLEKMQEAFGEEEKPGRDQLLSALQALSEDYSARAIELKKVASGYRLQTKMIYNPWVASLYTEKPAKYSRALLETLAVIAYRQPVTRADIEDIRGVAVSTAILRTLLDHNWVRTAGHRDVPGKPVVYVTTKYFLDHLNLASLKDLPPLVAIQGEAL